MFTPCHREEGALRLTWRSHALDLDGVAWFDSTRLRRYARNDIINNDIIKDTFAALLSHPGQGAPAPQSRNLS